MGNPHWDAALPLWYTVFMRDVIKTWADEVAGDMVAELEFYERAFGRLEDHDIEARGYPRLTARKLRYREAKA